MSSVNVLVVDDDRDILRLVQTILEDRGYIVTTSTDALDAMEKIHQAPFDLVLSDANMPYKSGFDLIKTIRLHEDMNKAALALLTARRDRKDVQYAMECGADDYIVKPVDPDLLLAKVDLLLKKRPPRHRPEIRFAESQLHMPVKWNVEPEIASVSEQGITIVGPITATPSSRLRIPSPLFDLIGINAPYVRVVSCTPVSGSTYNFLIRLSFVGLNEGELQKIRFWINTNMGLQKGPAT